MTRALRVYTQLTAVSLQAWVSRLGLVELAKTSCVDIVAWALKAREGDIHAAIFSAIVRAQVC